MQDSEQQVRAAAEAIGLRIPEERVPAITVAVIVALQQLESIRVTPTPVPTPTAFTAAWSHKE